MVATAVWWEEASRQPGVGSVRHAQTFASGLGLFARRHRHLLLSDRYTALAAHVLTRRVFPVLKACSRHYDTRHRLKTALHLLSWNHITDLGLISELVLPITLLPSARSFLHFRGRHVCPASLFPEQVVVPLQVLQGCRLDAFEFSRPSRDEALSHD